VDFKQKVRRCHTHISHHKTGVQVRVETGISPKIGQHVHKFTDGKKTRNKTLPDDTRQEVSKLKITLKSKKISPILSAKFVLSILRELEYELG
jgi:hypothetical protein